MVAVVAAIDSAIVPIAVKIDTLFEIILMIDNFVLTP